MTYGVKAWDESDNLVLDTNNRYTRLIYSTITSTDGSVDLPDIEGITTVQWGEVLDEEYSFGPLVTRSGTTIEWDNRIGSTTLILVFAYT